MNNYDYFNGWNYVDGVGNYITLSSKESGIDEQQIQKIVDEKFNNTELKQEGQSLQLSINGKEVSTVTIEDKYLHEVDFDENTKQLVFKLNDDTEEKRIDISNMFPTSNYVSKTELDNFKKFITSILGNNIDTVTTPDNKTKTDGDLSVTGSYVGQGERTTYTATKGNISCYDLNILDSSLALIAKNGSITIAELSTEGNCGKLRSLSADANDEISIKDCSLNENCYNGIQVNMDQALSDNVTIENIELNNVTNNGIIIFGTKENASINLKNIHIGESKNAFRFSNRSNAQSVVVNMENINVDSVREKLILFEDMKKVENKTTTDLFKNMTFNLKNVKLNGELITAETDIKTIIQMVVGRPSQSEDTQVELTEQVLPKFNFV